ncbi:lycopene cyclase [Mycobacterium antarcticum]|uniref:lycopene cyclase family protein n=1 Tax=unclassified Mycolicibacterium TaxID=2636767 RepID=UPI00239AD0A3|nr:MULTISPECIES: lycopene cyclase family protein [unclassified Mycolicibacterium]BDX35170.1 lycopene cyclase [Mycolicibacterium sp. TUM20985]GLP81432.1 lycopene cyclase [Mycolicibacterium sp. TUM20984]
MDVLVVGGGPAGLALAGACGRLGLATGLVDKAPDRPWTATYGMWSDELPADLPESAVAARAAGRAIAVTEHELGWEYAVLDVPALRAHLADGLTGVRVHAARVVGSPESGVVALADGSDLRASVIIDAGGGARPLDSSASRRAPAAQTAYGLVIDEAAAAPFVVPGDALFMDWRADHGEPGWPTFLYVIPLGGGQVLVEETSLARRPGLPLSTLRRRLHARLARHGVQPPKDARSERVSFRVDHPRHRGSGVLGFGAAAPLIHPATGFSLAASLRLAPEVAAALAAHLPDGPGRALAAAQKTVWPLDAQVVHRVRRIGLESLLRMPPADVPGFFEQFFALPDSHRWTYLTARDDVRGIVAAMNCLFRTSSGRLRRHLVTSALRPAVVTKDAGELN